MLDVLLSAERDGLIDAQGVREEVDIFTVAVCIQFKINSTPTVRISGN